MGWGGPNSVFQQIPQTWTNFFQPYVRQSFPHFMFLNYFNAILMILYQIELFCRGFDDCMFFYQYSKWKYKNHLGTLTLSHINQFDWLCIKLHDPAIWNILLFLHNITSSHFSGSFQQLLIIVFLKQIIVPSHQLIHI